MRNGSPPLNEYSAATCTVRTQPLSFNSWADENEKEREYFFTPNNFACVAIKNCFELTVQYSDVLYVIIYYCT